VQEQITTITFLRYNSLTSKIWAFGMMQFGHRHLSQVPGLTFYKLLGSGKAGFNPLPDWSVYAILQVWEEESAATNFFDKSVLMEKYRTHSKEQYTIYLKNIVARGEWSSKHPFKKHPNLDAKNPFLAVITRATIRTSQLINFWRDVPASQKQLHTNKGLLFTMGIGEAPVVQMATFSLWESKESLENFAYRSKEHQKVIAKTREVRWYNEELFSRFQPYKTQGNWFGKELLHFT
jgi:heme-degrading monooxygenase HmoA